MAQAQVAVLNNKRSMLDQQCQVAQGDEKVVQRLQAEIQVLEGVVCKLQARPSGDHTQCKKQICSLQWQLGQRRALVVAMQSGQKYRSWDPDTCFDPSEGWDRDIWGDLDDEGYEGIFCQEVPSVQATTCVTEQMDKDREVVHTFTTTVLVTGAVLQAMAKDLGLLLRNCVADWANRFAVTANCEELTVVTEAKRLLIACTGKFHIPLLI